MATVTDDFNRADGALGSDWTLAQGSADVGTNRMRVLSTGFTDVLAIHNTSVGSADQYVKLQFATTPNPQYPLVVLRYTNSSSPFYVVYLSGNDGTLEWYRFASVGGGNASITSGALSAFGSASDSLGVTIEGAGNATTLRFWKNPTGDAPTSAVLWGGAGPGLTFTTDPASPVDTGNFVGGGGTQGSANVFIDTFFGGSLGGGGASSILSQMMQHHH